MDNAVLPLFVEKLHFELNCTLVTGMFESGVLMILPIFPIAKSRTGLLNEVCKQQQQDQNIRSSMRLLNLI